MEITFLGHSSFKIKTKKAVLIADPFDSQMVGLKFPKTEASIVTLSHNHADHNQAAQIDGNPKVIAGPGEYEIAGVTVLGLPSYHDDKKGRERGQNTIFVFEVAGLRLAHLGDLGHTLDDKAVEAIGDLDVLMLPVGGTFTLDSRQAVTIVQALQPKYILPMHYQMPGLNPSSFASLTPVTDFTTALAIKVENHKKLKLSAPTSEAEQTVIILEKRS